MEFCPTCANMLLFELPCMDSPARYFCPTCPYVANIERNVKINKHIRLVKKPVDHVSKGQPLLKGLGKELDLPFQVMHSRGGDVTCSKCDNGEAYFTQQQTRSADEPMTIFFTCTKCEKSWTDN